jgi:hypothetical protein
VGSALHRYGGAVVEATELARKTGEIASHDIGLLERPTNSNRHPRIDAAHAYCGSTLGQPYCAALSSLWVHDAATALGVTPQFRKSARALGLWERNTDLRITPADLQPSHLPCFAILDHGHGRGHVYLVVGLNEAKTQAVAVDPNTTPKGDSRNGGGVYATTRPLTDPRLVGFVRIS